MPGFWGKEGMVFSVGDFLDVLNEFLVADRVVVQGEVTEVKRPLPSFVSFTLKDKNGESTMPCAMWKWDYEQSRVALEAGMEIKVTGNPEVYKKFGKFQFRAKVIEPVGEGSLKKAYDLLREKLEKEGLFARKRPLPQCMKNIGVISSKGGVVIHDFMENLSPLGFKVRFMDARVEGKEAISTILKAISAMNKMEDLDVVVIMRGGGSLESMQAFDSEEVAKAIFGSRVPVVCGIGHHVDVPIACLVADVSVSTPTAAAVRVNNSWEEMLSAIPQLQSDLFGSFEDMLQDARRQAEKRGEQILTKLAFVFDSFHRMEERVGRWCGVVRSWIEESKEESGRNGIALASSFSRMMKETMGSLDRISSMLDAASPERQLQLGYGIVRNSHGKIMKSAKDLSVGEKASVRLHKGSFSSIVEEIRMEEL